MQKNWTMTETLAYGYSSERTQRELSNDYQHDRVQMVFKNLCIRVRWTKVALALEGFTRYTVSDNYLLSGLYVALYLLAERSTPR